ncbi:MAG: DNA topoisomerase [Candidatus Heimdallarchaeota archaeon]
MQEKESSKQNVLVIGEKPSQVKAITSALCGSVTTEKAAERIFLRKGMWKGYNLIFLPLTGHITTLDTAPGFGWKECSPIDIVEDDKSLLFTWNKSFKAVISQQAKQVNQLWLATDPDSEGDNIAWEAFQIAIAANSRLKRATKRVWNSSLTSYEIERAFENLTSWNDSLALAVQGRRIVDAWVGFAGTREVTIAARRVVRQSGVVYSVGRVQLPTLKLIVDRDREREQFQTQDKYNLLADIRDAPDSQTVLITVKHTKSPFDNQKEVQELLKKLANVERGTVSDFESKTVKVPPPSPWNTTDALAILTKELGISADEALSLLVTLYEEGFVSYPRTDNRRFKDGFPHSLILEKLNNHQLFLPFLRRILDPDRVKTPGKKQGIEDHDPIHPTGEIPKLKNNITELHLKAWEYVSLHYIGMFMPDLEQGRGSVTILIRGEPFNQRYQQTLEAGWTAAIHWKRPKSGSPFIFKKDLVVPVGNIRAQAYKTKPPKLWSDSTIIRHLEQLGIGTKSSRPEILNKLRLRRYVSKKGRSNYLSTATGQSIIEVFEQIWPELVVPEFTRKVEAYMDGVADQTSPYDNMLSELKQYYIELHRKLISQLPKLQGLLQQSKSSIDMATSAHSAVKSPQADKILCPVCREGQLLQRYNPKTKKPFFGCSRYPTCQWTSPGKKNRQGVLVPVETEKDLVGPCPKCDGTLLLKRRKTFRLVGCSNYPRCSYSHFLPKKGRLYLLKEKCHNCGRGMISLTNREGKPPKVVKHTFCVICNQK